MASQHWSSLCSQARPVWRASKDGSFDQNCEPLASQAGWKMAFRRLMRLSMTTNPTLIWITNRSPSQAGMMTVCHLHRPAQRPLMSLEPAASVDTVDRARFVKSFSELSSGLYACGAREQPPLPLREAPESRMVSELDIGETPAVEA